MRNYLTIASMVVALIVIPGSAMAQILRIGWVYAMANAPILIAAEKGYFKQQGLDVVIIKYKNGPMAHQALSSGELDMAYIGSTPVYHWFARGMDSRILAKVNYGQAAMLVRKNSGIDKLSDLKNKKVAGVKIGSGMDVLLRGYVLDEEAKLKPDQDVQIVTMLPSQMESSLEQGQVSAAFMWEPFVSSALLHGQTKLIFDMNKAIPNYPWYVVMAMPNTLKTRRQDVIKVLRAHKQAVDYLNSSPKAGNDIIAKAFKLDEVEDITGQRHNGEKIVEMARERLGWAYELKQEDAAFIQRLMNYSYKLGYIHRRLSADEIIDNSLMRDMVSMSLK